MSVTTATNTQANSRLTINLDDCQDQTFGDWRDDFFRDGYIVLKNAIPEDRALAYRQKMLDWITGFGKGLVLDDPSTWVEANLPQSFKAGMYLNYCAAHEKYVWDARQEPGVLGAFEKIWGTKELSPPQTLYRIEAHLTVRL